MKDFGDKTSPRNADGMSKILKIALQCPICRRSGTAYVRNLGDRSPKSRDGNLQVVRMPNGFVEVYCAVRSRGGTFDVECVEHAISAVGGT